VASILFGIFATDEGLDWKLAALDGINIDS
jgi:hypothetical protein